MDGFPKRFKECRVEADLTQQSTAGELGVSIGTVACIETGRVPDLATAVKAAEYFNVSLDWLVRGIGPKRSRR